MADQLICTDMDGTFISDAYDFAFSLPGLIHARVRGVRIVYATSKTCAEMRAHLSAVEARICTLKEEDLPGWKSSDRDFARMNASMLARADVIFEGGAGMLLADAGLSARFGNIVALGERRSVVAKALRRASLSANVRVRLFTEMADDELALLTGFTSVRQCQLAKARLYTDPFTIDDGEDGRRRLEEALAPAGYRVVQGGRFYHVTKVTPRIDKGWALLRLLQMHKEVYGTTPESIGLGDAPNDLDFLVEVDHPVVVRSSVSDRTERMKTTLVDQLVAAGRTDVPLVTEANGPEGWSEAVQALIAA
ncbi:MAG: hypothetical protein IT290_01620 [Deltaproteobacteria bacterium]|nr:hypothetical protein [Deltaproteobacteria bacterium]